MGGKTQSKSNKGPAHEPDFKKPIDPKRVLQILEFRRRTMKFVESMLEPTISMEELQAGEELICQSDYDSIVQERWLLKICGYPLCPKEITKEWNQKFHISLKDRKIYDVEIRKLYCSVNCMNKSVKFRNDNVPERPIWMRLDDVRLDPNFEIQKSSP